MQRRPHRVRRAVLTVAFALSLHVPARAQNVGQYLVLAREYADGRGTEADASLARWTKDGGDGGGASRGRVIRRTERLR
jgi:hypothetical protein